MGPGRSISRTLRFKGTLRNFCEIVRYAPRVQRGPTIRFQRYFGWSLRIVPSRMYIGSTPAPIVLVVGFHEPEIIDLRVLRPLDHLPNSIRKNTCPSTHRGGRLFKLSDPPRLGSRTLHVLGARLATAWCTASNTELGLESDGLVARARRFFVAGLGVGRLTRRCEARASQTHLIDFT